MPPRRSIRTILKIWKNRRPRRAVITWPDVPIPITINEAAIVMTSEGNHNFTVTLTISGKINSNLPIIQKGLLRNFNLPTPPWYRDRHPDDHNL